MHRSAGARRYSSTNRPPRPRAIEPASSIVSIIGIVDTIIVSRERLTIR